MKFRLLGSMSIQHQGQELVNTSGKARQLLALLLLNEPHRVSNGSLITELWDDAPPRHAMTTLQTHIFYLRKELAQRLGVPPGEIAHELLQTHSGGYRINVSGASFDVSEFHRLRTRAAALLHAGDDAGGRRVVCEALALWRGPALLDVTQGRLLRAAVAELDESRLHTLALFFCTQLALGRHREILSQLARLVVRHPHHERLNAQFMIALHRSGHRTQALAVFDEMRRNMVGELGVTPPGWIARIREAIHLDDSAAVDEAVRNHAEALAAS